MRTARTDPDRNTWRKLVCQVNTLNTRWNKCCSERDRKYWQPNQHYRHCPHSLTLLKVLVSLQCHKQSYAGCVCQLPRTCQASTDSDAALQYSKVLVLVPELISEISRVKQKSKIIVLAIITQKQSFWVAPEFISNSDLGNDWLLAFLFFQWCSTTTTAYCDLIAKT